MIPPDALAGGFVRPVFDSQAVFRGVLDALSRPGRVVELPRLAVPPPPLLPPAGAVIAALADEGTPVFLGPSLTAGDLVGAWITFHTGAPITADPRSASFAVVGAAECPALDGFSLGTADYPDRSTTVVMQVAGFEGNEPMTLAGPGIAGTADIAPSPLPEGFVASLAANRGLFPRGVDLVLAAPAAIAALPRSVRVTAGGA